MVDPPARDGSDPDHGLGGFGQRDDPGEEHLPQGRWQPTARGFLACPEQFLDEERVAIRAAMDLIGEIGGRRRPEDRRQQRLGLGWFEAAQVDPLDATAALEFGQPRQERVAPVELVRPERHHQHDPVGAQVPDEERDGLAGRRVGPMEILDDEQDRGDLRQPLQHTEERVEQTGLVRFGLRRRLGHGCRAERRHEPGDLRSRRPEDRFELLRFERSAQRAECLDDRAVRDASVTDVRAATLQDPHPAGRRDLHRLEDQAGLADASLAGDQLVDGCRRHGAVEGPGDGVEFGRPADEGRADEAARHDPMIRAGACTTGRRARELHGARMSGRAGHAMVRFG